MVDDAEKVNGLTVETAVPALAVFIDTTYSIQDGELSQNNLSNALKSTYDACEPNDANTVLDNTTNAFTAAQRGWIATITYAASVTMDMDDSNRFGITLTGDTIFALPDNITVGQGGVIYITQNATGGHAVTWNSVFKFMDDTYTPDTTGNMINVYAYEVFDSTHIVMSYLGNM